MATPAQIVDALRTLLEQEIPDLHVYARGEEEVTPPCVIVLPDPDNSVDFMVTMGRGTDTWQWELSVLCSISDVPTHLDELYGYTAGHGPRSIRRVIFEHPTLGLTDGTTAVLTGITRFGTQLEVAGFPHVGAVMHMTVHTPGRA